MTKLDRTLLAVAWGLALLDLVLIIVLFTR